MGVLARWRQVSNVAQRLHPRGCYSIQRLRRFKTYMDESNCGRLLSVCLLTPMPCVALATLVESVPLDSPEAGPYKNYIFWIRAWIVTAFVDYSMVIQMSQSLARLKMEHSYIVMIALAGSMISFGVVFAVAVWISFPVPFSMLVASPPSVVVILVSIGFIWRERWRSDAALRQDLVRHTMVFMCQVALTFIYPLYIFGFSSISGVRQLFYVLLLPVIKSASRNWISYTLAGQDDIKPEVVIFNVEVFNALYVSSAVQHSSSLGTTVALMLIDVIHFWFSMRGTTAVLKKVKELMAKIPPHHPIAKENFVEVALRILAIQDRAQSHERLRSRLNKTNKSLILEPIQTYKNSSEDISLRAPTRAEILSVIRVGSRDVGAFKRLMRKASKVFPATPVQQTKMVHMSSGPRMDFKQPVAPCLGLEAIFSCNEREAFLNTTTHVLYITEYLVLVEYTEAVLPMVYALYSMIAFHLPNCTYNLSLANLSKNELLTNVSFVVAYSMLELTSLMVAMVVLKRVLGISPVHQLGFVLETQATMVQSKLMLWFVYVMQVPLEHVGTDFSFKFKWAHTAHQESET
ncbi:hypothetical protein F441_21937 [Phytophthora nicotianae CJ01A1]|uniref:Uncharacterized protein n=3 Tax=Phytophthora nicotianae TaxID=4792 RepID=W2QUB3_PHYN3|nr:hypothetical protein PPTG_06121 [Phytophthora nicotianae INRA-310]ETK72071.1 hypothetical protein L915_20767 [Phytophthora nicotianae]ETL25500.1 hypothetical protein L916_20652 [Phytophthora nicotianae]ETN15840.1 hypothetical protein PPTG_06121 [Phytophthora nicotianae INRA-310]ETP00713.1 hypothetical protein F441_21937 [Phytophthora nicotianae CJ01A1]